MHFAAVIVAAGTGSRAGGAPKQWRLLKGRAIVRWSVDAFKAAGANPVVPPRVERYTADFKSDDTLALGLDCNRATARWQVVPSGRGTLSVLPGAMTRAFCGDGALDTRIAQDLEKIRSFKVEDGRLFLTLEAGAGTYVWRSASGGN